MEDLLFKIALIVGGFLFTRFMLTKVLSKVQTKQNFTREYVSILNNPEFKVKRSHE